MIDQQVVEAALLDILHQAGAQFAFIDPTSGGIPRTRHVLGGLRFGHAAGRVHGFDNLYCMDGGVMPTASGYNPTLTLIALALRAAANLVAPGAPERRLGTGPLA